MSINAQLPAVHDDDGLPCPGHHDPVNHPWGSPVWCIEHAHTIAMKLARIPHLAAQVGGRRDGRLLTGRTGADLGVRVHSSPEPTSQSPAWDHLDELLRWARDWADRAAWQLRRHHDDPGDHTPHGLPILDVTGDVTYLARYLTPLLVGPWAHDFGQEVLTRVRDLERLTGMEPARTRLRAPCPRCGYLSLVRDDGTDRVECTYSECRHLLAPRDVTHLLTDQEQA